MRPRNKCIGMIVQTDRRGHSTRGPRPPAVHAGQSRASTSGAISIEFDVLRGEAGRCAASSR